MLENLLKKFRSPLDRCRLTETALVVLGFFLAVITLANTSADIGDVYYVWWMVLAVFLIIACARKLHIFDLYTAASKKHYVLAAIFSAFFLVMSPLSEIIKLNCLRFSGKTAAAGFLVPFNWLFFLAAAAALYGELLFALRYAESLKDDTSAAEGCTRKTFFICWGICAAVTFACAFAGYPAIPHNDGLGIWESNSDWHTISYVLFTKLCMAVWNHPFSIVLAQSIIWCLTCGLVLDTVRRYKGGYAVVVYTVLSLTVGFSVYKYMAVLYKDVIFIVAMLGYSAGMYRMMKHVNISNTVYLAVYAAAASIMRHGAIIAVVIGLIVFALVYLVKKRPRLALRIAACCIAPAVAVYAGLQVYINLVDIEKNPSYVTYTVPLYMLGAYAASGLEISEETAETMEKIMPLEDWAEAYEADHYWADHCSRTWGIVGDRINQFEEQHLQLPVLKANWEFFTQAPLTYLRILFDINSLVWEMSRPDGTYAEWVVADFDTENPEAAADQFPQWFQNPPGSNAFESIMTPLSEASFNIPIWRIPAYRGGLHVWGMLFVCAAVFQKDRKLLLLAIPFAVYAGMLLLSLPAQDPRFIFPFVQFSCFFSVTALCKDRREDKTEAAVQESVPVNTDDKEYING